MDLRRPYQWLKMFFPRNRWGKRAKIALFESNFPTLPTLVSPGSSKRPKERKAKSSKGAYDVTKKEIWQKKRPIAFASWWASPVHCKCYTGTPFTKLLKKNNGSLDCPIEIEQKSALHQTPTDCTAKPLSLANLSIFLCPLMGSTLLRNLGEDQ